MSWYLCDINPRTGEVRRYAGVQRDYETREEAEAVLEDLLEPYPDGHAWRKRLAVAERQSASERDNERKTSGRAGGLASGKRRACVSYGPAAPRVVTLPDGSTATVRLTQSQAEVLAVYVAHLTEHGRPPHLTAIGERLGIASKSVIHKHVAALQSQGVEIVKIDTRFSPQTRKACVMPGETEAAP